MPRHIFKVEQAVLDSLESRGGSLHISALARDPEVAKNRGAGVEMIDVILAMMVRGLVAFDPQTKTVTAPRRSGMRLVEPQKIHADLIGHCGARHWEK